MAGAVHGLHGHCILRRQGLLQDLALEDAALDALLHHALSAAGSLLPDVGGHALLAGQRLQASSLAAPAQRSFRLKDHVAVLRRLELVAREQLPVQDQAAAHAGAREKSDHVLISSGCAVLELAQHADVHVVADEERHAELLLDGRLDIVISPGKIRGKEDDALRGINDARSARRDGADVLLFDAGSLQHLRHDADDDFLHILLGVAALFRLLLQTVDDLFVLVEDRSQDLGPADIKTDIIFSGHACFPP